MLTTGILKATKIKYLCFENQMSRNNQMQKTDTDKSLEGFSFVIYYLDNLVNLNEIGDPNIDDVLYIRCYPNWVMQDKELMKLIEENKLLLLNKMKSIVEEFDLFYCYFDIDFSKIYGSTTNVMGKRVNWIEVRPYIKMKNLEGYPSGFIDPKDIVQDS